MTLARRLLLIAERKEIRLMSARHDQTVAQAYGVGVEEGGCEVVLS